MEPTRTQSLPKRSNKEARTMDRNILEREQSGEAISPDDPEYPTISAILRETARWVFEMNSRFHDEAEVRSLFSRITGVDVDETFRLRPPFYTDFGRNIRVGKNVFINHGCIFMDRGGIVIEDDVLIAPKVSVVTTNHLINPVERRTTISSLITIKKNAWIGIGATIMPGVTIGENAIVGAASVVTRNVPANTIVAGAPARVVQRIDTAGPAMQMGS